MLKWIERLAERFLLRRGYWIVARPYKPEDLMMSQQRLAVNVNFREIGSHGTRTSEKKLKEES